MSINHTASQIVEPVQNLDLKTASSETLNAIQNDLLFDVNVLEDLITDLRDHIFEAQHRISAIDEELMGREQEAEEAA